MYKLPLRRKMNWLTAALGTVLLLASCGGAGDAGPEATAPAPPFDSAPAGQQISQELWTKLTLELERVLKEEGRNRSTSAVATGKGSAVGNLELFSKEGVGSTLCWNYRNQGDYDLNGVVTIADLTPIGIHFGKSFADSDWQEAQFADGDRNGEVNIGDVTPIGQNFGGQVDGFELQSRSELAFPPDETFGTYERFPFVPGDPTTGQYPYYEYELGLIIADPQFRVVPYVEDGMSYTYGTPGNIVQTLGGGDPWPARAANVDRTGRSRSPGPTSSAVDWEFEAEGSSYIFASPVADDNGNVYFGTALSFSDVNSSGWIYSVTADGQLNWRYPAGASLLTPGIGPKGNIIFGDTRGFIYSMTADGVQEWRTEIVGAPVLSAFTFDDENGICFQTTDITGSGTGVLYRLLPDGTLDWNRSFDKSINMPLLIDPDGRIVVTDEDGVVYFYLTDGTLDTSIATGADPPFLSHTVTLGTSMVIPDDVSDQLVFQPYNGLPQTLVPLGGSISGGPSVTADGNVVVAISDSAAGISNLLFVDSFGIVIDNIPLPGVVIGSIAVDSDGRIYLWRVVQVDTENERYFIRCLGPDGSVLWEREMDGAGIAPIVAGEGKLALQVLGESLAIDSAQKLVMIGE